MKETKRITEIAVLIAVAAVLEAISTFIPFLHMPQGGSVSLGMLPIFFIAFKYGVKDGMIAGFIFGIINFALGGFLIHWGSIFFDYFLAFTFLGLAGVFKNSAIDNKNAFIKGILLGGFLRYLMHSLSGVLFFAQYAGTEGAFIYSFIFYNLPYMTISIVLCIVIGLSIKDRLINYL
jgi:thiamine transporter